MKKYPIQEKKSNFIHYKHSMWYFQGQLKNKEIKINFINIKQVFHSHEKWQGTTSTNSITIKAFI